MHSSKLTVYYAGYSETSINTLLGALKQYKIGTLVDCRTSPNPSTISEYKLKNIEKKCKENNIKYCWKGKEFGGKHQINKLLTRLCNNEARIAEDFLCCVFSVIKQPSLMFCECKNIINCHCKYIADALIKYNLANIKTITIHNDNINNIECVNYKLAKDTKLRIIGFIPNIQNNIDDDEKAINENKLNHHNDLSKYLKSMEEQDTNCVLNQFEEKWKKEQLTLKEKLILRDDFNFYLPHEKEKEFNIDDIFKNPNSDKGKKRLQYIGGVDISHGTDDEDLACAGLVILEYPSLKQVYEKFNIVRFNQPYIAGFLAFREVDFLLTIIDEIRADSPEYLPQIILVDGNGILHHRGFGLACHLGVLCGIPTIGVAKNLLVVDGLDKKKIKTQCEKQLLKRGDMFELIGQTNNKLGVALRCSKTGKTPVYVSNGHRISLKSAIEIVMACSPQFKQPEPIRCVDNGTRQTIAQYETTLKQINKQ